MEKLIVYAIGGILYFLYTLWKKGQEEQSAARKQQQAQTETPEGNQPGQVRPPAGNAMEDVIREIKRKQAAAEAQRKLSNPKPVQSGETMFQKAEKPKDLFIHEKKKATFGQGADDAPVYERDPLPTDKIVRGDIKLKNEGIYQVETMEEARAKADNTETTTYEFDAKQAFIGSIIFEQKF